MLFRSSGLKDTAAVPVRIASSESAVRPSEKSLKRGVGDLVRAMNGFLFLTCVCGLKIKVPPDFKQSSLPCPRCQRELQLPAAELATVVAGIEAASGKLPIDPVAAAPTQATYTRKGVGWESFQCTCGKNVQLSPAFKGSKIVCSSCGTLTTVVGNETK